MENHLNATLLLGDCRETLSQVPRDSIDCVITDPPYRVASGGQTDTAATFYKNGTWLNDGKIFTENDFTFDVDFLNSLHEKMTESSHIYWFTNFLNLADFLVMFEESEFYVHNLLVWEKRVVVNRWYMKNCEYVIFAKKGPAKSINDKSSKTVHYFDVPKNKVHPTEKPVDLIEFYVRNSTEKAQTVLDPFMGSGTTGVACARCDRMFIGIEKDPLHFSVARRRVDAALNEANSSLLSHME